MFSLFSFFQASASLPQHCRPLSSRSLSDSSQVSLTGLAVFLFHIRPFAASILGDFNIRADATANTLTSWSGEPRRLCRSAPLLNLAPHNWLRSAPPTAPPQTGASDHSCPEFQLSHPHSYRARARGLPRDLRPLGAPFLPPRISSLVGIGHSSSLLPHTSTSPLTSSSPSLLT